MQSVPRDIDMEIDGEDSEHDEADFRQTRKFWSYSRVNAVRMLIHRNCIERRRLERMGIF